MSKKNLNSHHYSPVSLLTYLQYFSEGISILQITVNLGKKE